MRNAEKKPTTPTPSAIPTQEVTAAQLKQARDEPLSYVSALLDGINKEVKKGKEKAATAATAPKKLNIACPRPDTSLNYPVVLTKAGRACLKTRKAGSPRENLKDSQATYLPHIKVSGLSGLYMESYEDERTRRAFNSLVY